MTIAIIIAGSSVVIAAVAVGGVIVTWRKNGKSQAARDERIALNQENIVKKLDDPNHGLTAINDKVNDMVNNCAKVSTGLTERMKTAERDIKDLEHKSAP